MSYFSGARADLAAILGCSTDRLDAAGGTQAHLVHAERERGRRLGRGAAALMFVPMAAFVIAGAALSATGSLQTDPPSPTLVASYVEFVAVLFLCGVVTALRALAKYNRARKRQATLNLITAELRRRDRRARLALSQ